MKYILTAVMALILSTTAYAESNQEQWSKGINVPNNMVKWFISREVPNYDGRTVANKIKPYGDDTNVINPHIKDWYVNVEIKDAAGNVTGFNQVYSHSIVRFTDINGQTFNITFLRTPVVKAELSNN